MKAEIVAMALFTPQTGLALIVASLVLVSNRQAKKMQSTADNPTNPLG
jgi:hypothetical protein